MSTTNEAPTVSAYWQEPTDPEESGYWVIQVDDVEEDTPMRVYVNDGNVYRQGGA